MDRTHLNSSNDTDYKHLFRESPVPMYVYDEENFQILEINTSSLHQYGYNRREFLQLTALDIRPAQDENSFREINKSLPQEYFDAGRWRHQKKNGEIFYVQVYSHKVFFEGRKAVLVLALNIDKQIRNEIKLSQMVAFIENQKDKLKHVSWVNSHRIRNHVANILGLIALYDIDKPDHDMCEMIFQNIQFCANELDNVLREIANDI